MVEKKGVYFFSTTGEVFFQLFKKK